MKKEIIKALEKQFEAGIIKHKINIEVMLANPTSVPEHTDFMQSIEKELAFIADYQDKLDAIRSHF